MSRVADLRWEERLLLAGAKGVGCSQCARGGGVLNARVGDACTLCPSVHVLKVQ